MRTKLVIFLMLTGAQPAEACRRFSQWYYPYPQKCRVSHVSGIVSPKYAALTPEPVHRPPEIEPDQPPIILPPSVIVVIPPPASIPNPLPVKVMEMPHSWDEVERKSAVEKIRNILNKRKEAK